jgi:hypothetical protein
MILLCEPQCWGFEHATFNAALLGTALLAYPEAPVIFAGECEHLEWVRRILSKHDEKLAQRVEWLVISIPKRLLGGRHRLAEEWGEFKSILEFALKRQAQLLIFCSVTNTGLFALKLWLFQLRRIIPTIAIPHSILNSILERQPRRPWYWVLSLRQVLRLPHPRGLHYIALGEPIYRCLTQALPSTSVHFDSLDPPYFWTVHAGELVDSVPQRIRLGHLGVANRGKGFYTFGQLAAAVSEQVPNVQFALAGFVDASDGCLEWGRYVQGVGSDPLTPEEYARRANSLTYVIGTADSAHYRLVASASFLDALSFVKPGIYLRNPYVEHYFGKMGDIGYLCDSYEEMRGVILAILKEFPLTRYRKQCENILRGRRIFEPQELAPQLRAIVGDIKYNMPG